MKTVLVLLFCASLKIGLTEGNNSTAIGNNVSGSVNSTTLPSTQVKTVVTTTIEQETTTEGEYVPGKLYTGTTTPASQHSENNGTTGAAVSKGDLPFWVYILIACAIVVVLGAIAVAAFVKYDRWKNQGSYMVWDSGELQLSPAFISRESEFLIDNLAADQEPGSPELQLYEIPLDSLGHQRVCIGAKRVAPRRQTHSSKNTNKLLKDRSKKNGQQFQVHTNTLPRLGKRDQMYSAANNGVNSALSEGDISEDRMNSNITFTKMTLRSGKNGSKPLSLGSIGRSGSTQLFQNRPLPAAPSKRFSKSLDRLRFLELFPNSKHSKAATISARPLPRLPSHPSLVKSMSCGTNLHQMIANAKDRPGSPPDIKSSLDFQEQLDTSRKSMISHRHSKSLDTLLLLKELDWMSFEIDINHSYESMHRSKNEMEDSPYASVETSNQTSPRCSDHKSSLSTSLRGSQSPSDVENCDENEENPYASVSEEESWPKGEGLTKFPLHFKKKPSNATLSPSVSSEDAMPYASVRISQIPGIGPSHDYSSQGDKASCPGEVFEDSGSSLEAVALSVEGTDSSRPVSTATYLEILPDHTRASMISETSSGYARPIDLRPHDVEPQDGNDTDPPEKCNSLTDLMVPVVETLPSTINHHDNQDSDIYVPIGPPTYTCENSNQKSFDSEMEHESDICVNKTDEEPERHATGNKDDPSADSSDKDSAAVFENAAFVDSLVSEDSYL